MIRESKDRCVIKPCVLLMWYGSGCGTLDTCDLLRTPNNHRKSFLSGLFDGGYCRVRSKRKSSNTSCDRRDTEEGIFTLCTVNRKSESMTIFEIKGTLRPYNGGKRFTLGEVTRTIRLSSFGLHLELML